MWINGTKCQALVDSGASVNLINLKQATALSLVITAKTMTLHGIGGRCTGLLTLPTSLKDPKGRTLEVTFVVIEDDSIPILLGQATLTALNY